ncbi:MAG: biotin/lipoyl-containing protein, partial [Pseudomonadota bacterium]|nr:biotin/lipoyl-containing protein [Pseudomonadota bacterium]
MSIEIRVPDLGESITDATIAHWLKAEGDVIECDEAVVELETDKVTLEVYAPEDGIL